MKKKTPGTPLLLEEECRGECLAQDRFAVPRIVHSTQLAKLLFSYLGIEVCEVRHPEIQACDLVLRKHRFDGRRLYFIARVGVRSLAAFLLRPLQVARDLDNIAGVRKIAEHGCVERFRVVRQVYVEELLV